MRRGLQTPCRRGYNSFAFRRRWFNFFASGFGLAPLRLLRFAFEPNGDGLGPGDANFLMPSLGVTAMILSVLGFAALFLYQRHPRWLWVWFFVTALSVVMAIDNSAFAAGRGEIMMGSVLHALFMLIATYALWRRAPAL